MAAEAESEEEAAGEQAEDNRTGGAAAGVVALGGLGGLLAVLQVGCFGRSGPPVPLPAALADRGNQGKGRPAAFAGRRRSPRRGARATVFEGFLQSRGGSAARRGGRRWNPAESRGNSTAPGRAGAGRKLRLRLPRGGGDREVLAGKRDDRVGRDPDRRDVEARRLQEVAVVRLKAP